MQTYEEQLERDWQWALLEGSMHFEKQSAVYQTLERLTKKLTELGVDYARGFAEHLDDSVRQLYHELWDELQQERDGS